MPEPKKDTGKDLRRTREGMRKAKEKTAEGGESLAEAGWPPAWCVSFSDMTTLLMCFFVLWYSLTAMKFPPELLAIRTATTLFPQLKDKEERQKLLNAIKEKEISKEEVEEEIVMTPAKEKFIIDVAELRKLIGALEGYLEEEGLLDQVDITLTPEEIIITPLNTVLFSKAQATLRSECSKLLDTIILILKVSPGRVHIEGHTDDTPIGPFSKYRYNSNWELSCARAVAVAGYLIKNGIKPERITVSGYGPSKPAYPNITQEGRIKNRRVEFHILVQEKEET